MTKYVVKIFHKYNTLSFKNIWVIAILSKKSIYLLEKKINSQNVAQKINSPRNCIEN